MKPTIEEIHGKKYTVVWREGYADDHVKSCWLELGEWLTNEIGYVLYYAGSIFATAIPALRRNPTPEDARLLHLYAAHGLTVMGKVKTNYATMKLEIPALEECDEITHATMDGERVEIAIEE